MVPILDKDLKEKFYIRINIFVINLKKYDMENKDVNNKIKTELENSGYDFAIAVATKSEIENGAACGQLSIIAETEEDNE